MKKTYKIEYQALLQNDEFVRLLIENPLRADQFIEELCLENPDREESIRLAARLVSSYQAEQMDVDVAQIATMWNNILRKATAKKPVHNFRIAPFWWVAASVALLFSFTFYLFENSGNHSLRKFAEERVEIGNEAKIIISDGSEHWLTSKDSRVRYDADGKEISIEEKNQIEKLNNRAVESKNVYNQIVVPYGTRQSVTLSDGTVVQLNSGSKLTFPAKFSGAKREVFLNGEGYFEVAKDAGKPFIVSTELMNVKVLGTHFNVNAYENDKTTSAVLVEGSIEVYNNNLFNKDLCQIKPGEGCFFAENSPGFKIQNVEVKEHISWKDGYFQFKDKPFANLIKKVEQYYHKTIAFGDNELAHRALSGKLVLAPKFEETLDFLARTTNSRCVEKGDGTYVFMK